MAVTFTLKSKLKISAAVPPCPSFSGALKLGAAGTASGACVWIPLLAASCRCPKVTFSETPARRLREATAWMPFKSMAMQPPLIPLLHARAVSRVCLRVIAVGAKPLPSYAVGAAPRLPAVIISSTLRLPFSRPAR